MIAFALSLIAGLIVAYPFALAAYLILQSFRRRPRVPTDFDLGRALARTRRIAYGRAARGRVQ